MDLTAIWNAATRSQKPTSRGALRRKRAIKKVTQFINPSTKVSTKSKKPRPRSTVKVPIKKAPPMEDEDLNAQKRLDELKFIRNQNQTNTIAGFQRPDLEKGLRQLRWLNLGDEKIIETIRAIKSNNQLPSWAIMFQEDLTVTSNRLHWKQDMFLFKDDKRRMIKKIYFNPKKGATIQTIYDEIRLKYANVTKRNVADVLKGIETYSRNLPKQNNLV